MKDNIINTRRHVWKTATLAILIYVAAFTVGGEKTFAAPSKPKVWVSSDQKFELATATPAKVVLRKTGNRELVEGPWNKLSPGMKEEIRSFWVSQDSEQLEKVRKAFASQNSDAEALYQVLRDLHDEYPFSPYAGLALAVSQAGLMNDPEKALVVLRQVVVRIETQRALMPDVHATTLASTYCNAAVCGLKQKKGDQAVSNLIKSLECRQTPVAELNARQLLEAKPSAGSAFALSDIQRDRLQKSLPEQKTDFNLAPGWYYSMAIDPSDARDKSVTLPTVTPPSPGLRLNKIYAGIAVGEELVLTSDQICRNAKNIPKMLTVQMVGLQANVRVQLLSYGVTSQEQSLPVTGEMKQNPIFVSMQTYSPIALLQVDSKLPSFIRIQEEVKVEAGDIELRFPTVESLSKTELLHSTPYQVTSGLGGVPSFHQPLPPHVTFTIAVNKQKQIMGFLDASGTVPGKPKILSRQQVAQYANSVLGLGMRPQSSSPSAIDDSALAAVLEWVPATETLAESEPLIPQSIDRSAGLAIRDDWCIPCGGKGMYRCPQCNKGVVFRKEPRQIATNPLNGTPIMGTVQVPYECNNCKGAGLLECPYCDRGRLRSQR